MFILRIAYCLDAVLNVLRVFRVLKAGSYFAAGRRLQAAGRTELNIFQFSLFPLIAHQNSQQIYLRAECV